LVGGGGGRPEEGGSSAGGLLLDGSSVVEDGEGHCAMVISTRIRVERTSENMGKFAANHR
jgi:hypothetical protein